MQLRREIIGILNKYKLLKKQFCNLRRLPSRSYHTGSRPVFWKFFGGFKENRQLLRRGLLVCFASGLGGFVLWLKNVAISNAECSSQHNNNNNNNDVNGKRRSLSTANLPFIESCYQPAIRKARVILEKVKTEFNCPAITVTVTVDGEVEWSEGLGLVDIENSLPCTTKSVMRIASISKPLTMAVVAKLIQDGELDLDLPVQRYVPEWPEKSFNGKPVTVTTRQLVSMLAGIRHYDKDCKYREASVVKRKKSEFEHGEYYLNESFESVIRSLELFKNDDLCSFPGTQFLYSSHNWTLVSAVVEKISKRRFEDVMKEMFNEMGLYETYLDDNYLITPHRARYYFTNKRGRLQNATPVDNSYKWAGGGLQATPSDLCKFGNIMLACYQGIPLDYRIRDKDADGEKDIKCNDQPSEKGGAENPAEATLQKNKTPLPEKLFLSPDAMKMIWAPVKKARCPWDRNGYYAMGWCSVPARPMMMTAKHDSLVRSHVDHSKRQYFSHTGGAVGASSVLLVMPRENNYPIHPTKTASAQGAEAGKDEPKSNEHKGKPQGTVVAIVTNMQSVGLNEAALQIAALFETAREYKYACRQSPFHLRLSEGIAPEHELMFAMFFTDD